MTIEAANLKLRRVSSGAQYSSGGEQGLHLTQSETRLGERVKNTVVTLSVRLHNGKGCLRPFANIVQTAFKIFLQVFKFSFQISRFIDSFQ